MQSFNRFLCLHSKQSGKRSQAPDVLSLRAVDGFKKIKQRFEVEKILYKLYRIDIKIFFLRDLFFQFEFFFHFDLQMHKTHLKSFVLEILCNEGYSSMFYLLDGKV